MRLIAAALLAVSLAGCGAAHATQKPKRSQAAVEREVRDAIREYDDAVLAADATRYCAAFAMASRIAIRRVNGEECVPHMRASLKHMPEPLRARRTPVIWIVVRGNRATAGLKPDDHTKDPSPRLQLVREPTGWKILWDLSHVHRDNAYERCYAKTIRNAVSNPGWRDLADETLNEYADRYCDRVEDLPDDATRRDYDKLDWAILEELYDEGKLSWRDAQNLKARRA
jgi:hypothetical protein